MKMQKLVYISVQDEWSLALKNVTQLGRGRCPLCMRWDFSLNYFEGSVELEKDDLAIIVTVKRAPDGPAYWLLEPVGKFDVVTSKGEFDICPACLATIQKTDEIRNLVAPRQDWTGHVFAHPRNFRPWLTYVLSDVANEIEPAWPGAFRFSSDYVILSDQSFPDEGAMGN